MTYSPRPKEKAKSYKDYVEENVDQLKEHGFTEKDIKDMKRQKDYGKVHRMYSGVKSKKPTCRWT